MTFGDRWRSVRWTVGRQWFGVWEVRNYYRVLEARATAGAEITSGFFLMALAAAVLASAGSDSEYGPGCGKRVLCRAVTDGAKEAELPGRSTEGTAGPHCVQAGAGSGRSDRQRPLRGRE